VVASGGHPVTVSSNGMGILMTPAPIGYPVTIVSNYGVAVIGLGGSDVPPNYAMMALPASFSLSGQNIDIGVPPVGAPIILTADFGAFLLTAVIQL
jgi:hypothetical protein